jgi:hypothetical protein
LKRRVCGQTQNCQTYVDALVGETGRYSRALFFGFTEEDGEFLDRGHGDVPAVVAGQKGLVYFIPC